MVLVHFTFVADSTLKNRFRLVLSHPIPLQPIRYVKSCVRASYNATGANTNTTIYARMPWLTHFEITSNTNENLLPISFLPQPVNGSDTTTYTESNYDITFKAEDIPREFDVDFFKDGEGTPMNFHSSTNNCIRSIELYFETAHNDTFH